MDDIAFSDHLFVLMDADGKSGRGVINMIGGKVMNIAASDYANDNWFSNIFSWNNTRSAVHEFGHAVGLYHDTNNRSNLMYSGSSSASVTSNQRRAMYRNQNDINRGNNHEYGKKSPNPYVTVSEWRNGQNVRVRYHINSAGLRYGR